MPLNWWCWRRLLRVPWTVRRYNQSILKEISPEYSLEGLILKQELQSFGHLIEGLTHWKRPWCWERLKAGGEGDDRVWDWMASPTQWTWVWVNSSSRWGAGRSGVLQSLGSQRIRQDWATELNWVFITCVYHVWNFLKFLDLWVNNFLKFFIKVFLQVFFPPQFLSSFIFFLSIKDLLDSLI